MKTIYVAFVGSHGMDLDTLDVKVRNPEDCGREILAAITHANWVFSVGDRVEIREMEAR